MTAAVRPMPFVSFCQRVLGLLLTRGQRVLCAIAFDGVQPHELEGVDREIARQLLGDVDDVPALARRVLVLVLGRGSGKSTIAAAYGVWRMVTSDLSRCGPGDMPHVVVIAPGKRTAGLAVRMALALVQGSRAARAQLESETADGFEMRRPDGRLVAFAAFAASRGGASARGLSVLSFILDEAQFFTSDSEFVVNDRDIFSAIVPRLMPGGAGVFISTPWPVTTLMGELHEKNFGSPTTALAALAPTLVMREDDETLVALIAAERDRDPENAAREFDCDASLTAGSSQFFDPAAIRAAVDLSLVLPLAAKPGVVVSCGADFGFRSDSSAIVVSHKSGVTMTVAELDELRPKKEAPLQPSVVVGRFATIVKRHGCSYVIADSHYREAIAEHLRDAKLYFVSAPEGATGKLETYARARALLHEGRVRLPNHPRLLEQLRAIVSKPTPGGGLTITSPRRTGGGHGDLVSAFVLAVSASGGATVRAPNTESPIARWQRLARENAERKVARAKGATPRELDRRFGTRPRAWWGAR